MCGNFVEMDCWRLGVLSVLESKGLANYFKISKASCLWIYEDKLKNKIADWKRTNTTGDVPMGDTKKC